MELRAYRIRGRVQGVGFRWWARDVATELGLGGYVRNLPDGSVEVHATGTPEALADLEAALREGPAASRVDDVQPIVVDRDVPRDCFLIKR